MRAAARCAVLAQRLFLMNFKLLYHLRVSSTGNKTRASLPLMHPMRPRDQSTQGVAYSGSLPGIQGFREPLDRPRPEPVGEIAEQDQLASRFIDVADGPALWLGCPWAVLLARGCGGLRH